MPVHLLARCRTRAAISAALTMTAVFASQGWADSAASPATVPSSTQPASTQPATQPTAAEAAAATQPATQPTVQSLEWLGPPTRVGLSLKDVSGLEAFKALETASGISIQLPQLDAFDRQADRRVSVELQDRTWLEAAVEIADKANIRLSYSAGRWNAGFGGDVRTTPRRHFVGPLLATCNRVMVEHEVKYGRPHTATQTLTITGSLLAEPRVQSMQIERTARLIEAIDDQGRPLPAVVEEKPVASASLSAQQFLSVDQRRDFTITMRVPNADAVSVRRVKAMLRVAVLSRTESLSIPDVLNAEGFVGRVGDAKFKVERIEAGPQGYNLVMNVEPGSLPPGFAAGVRSSVPPFQPKIGANNAGVGTDVRVTSTGMRSDKSMQFTLLVSANVLRRNPPADADAGNEPDASVAARPNVDLTWPLPMAYQQVDVPIEFNDIPLPK